MRLPYVELHPCFRYDCDECGRENFIRGITLEDEHLSEEQRELLQEAEFWVVYPELVQCESCDSFFLTMNGEEDAESREDEI
tara:strand:- start:37 stop:282 length:246 start_codon:yes stop_codon:yes gene_type:complete